MCQKCEANANIAAGYTSEVWTGFFDGQKRWYDMSRAKRTLAAAGGVPESRLVEIDVDELWHAQVSHWEFDPERLPHVDLAEPLILGATETTPAGDVLSLMDGIHRVARAYVERVPTLKAIQLSLAFTADIRIPDEAAVLEELATEIVLTGGSVVGLPGGQILLAGGQVAPLAANDHPLRAVYLSHLAAGKGRAVFDVVPYNFQGR